MSFDTLKNTNNVEQYTCVTEEFMNKYKNQKIDINSATAYAITKVRALEIEYFSKSRENGAACIMFERLLSLPPSDKWRMVNKELISPLQYWLQAIKKRLLSDVDLWWKFLKLILKMIKDICGKDPSMPDQLVELTAESLLDLATTHILSTQRQHEILHCFNEYCGESSREIRLSVRTKLSGYFTKLAQQLSSCGYLPLQFNALQALVRWLLPRGEPSLRAAAAERWFPQGRCPETARAIFLHTAWRNFFQDARDFLNAVNEANGLVTSVECRRLFVGDMVIISGAETQTSWLDINTGVSSVSIFMDPRVLQCVEEQFRACETLVIEAGGVRAVTLHSDGRQVTVSVRTRLPPRVQPCGVPVGAGRGDVVTIVVGSRTDFRKLDFALRAAFGDHYQVQMNLDTELTLSPTRETTNIHNSSSEESRFSLPVKRGKHTVSGCGHKTFRHPFRSESLASRSSASTTSLAKLHNKLADHSPYRYTTKYNNVCEKPQLSNVTEISETDDVHSIQSMPTLNLSSYGFVNVSLSKKKAESDTELLKQKSEISTLRSAVHDELPTTSILATALKSNDSVIADSIEHNNKNKEFLYINIVDLIVQEALGVETTENRLKDSGINSDEKKSQDKGDISEAIENTPNEDNVNFTKRNRVTKKKLCTVVNKSTTEDESNTEAIFETPTFVNPRRSKLKQTQITSQSKKCELSFDAQRVEEFFTQNIAESKTGRFQISPDLARKINASSSSSSESVDENLVVNEVFNVDVFEMVDIDVTKCLNDMLDEVCNSLLPFLSSKNNQTQDNKSADVFVNNQTRTANKSKKNTPKKKTKTASKSKKNNTTSKLDTTKRSESLAQKGKNLSAYKELPTKMSTIIERQDEEVLDIDITKQNVENAQIDHQNQKFNEKETVSPAAENLIVKRKRKLYSPKDDDIMNEIKLSDSEDTGTPKTVVKYYKDIEPVEKRRIRQPRSKKPPCYYIKSPSPTTLENDALFDKVKSTVDNDEKFIVIDAKSAEDVYNYSSDSDFELKRVQLRKRIIKTKIGSKVSSESSTPAKPAKRRTRRNNPRKSYENEAKKTNQVKKETTTKKTNIKSKAGISIKPPINLDDERMREADPEEVLNTSIVNPEPNTKEPLNVTLIRDNRPEMEPAIDDQEWGSKKVTKTKKINKKTPALLLKKGSKTTSNNDDSGTLSPLPGLIVEAVPTRKDDTNNSAIAEMGRKFQKICAAGRDAINDTSDTQNMLYSDLERCPHNISEDITDETRNFAEMVDSCVSKKRKVNIKTENNSRNSSLKKFKVKQDKIIRNEVIEISETFNAESEKSISTNGIHAHANSNEQPPSPGMLETCISPREIVDMNESMINNYETLNRELYASLSESEKDMPVASIKGSSIASVDKCMPFDIRKMVPSRRTSYSSNSDSSKHIGTTKSIRSHEKLSKDTKQEVKSKTNRKFPIVPVVPLTIEDIARWTTPSSSKSDYQSEAKRAKYKSPTNSPNFVYNTRKAVNNMIRDDQTTDESEMYAKDKYSYSSDRLSKYAKSVAQKTNAKCNAVNNLTGERRSAISPINMNFAPLLKDSGHSSINKPTSMKGRVVKISTLNSSNSSTEIRIPYRKTRKVATQKLTPNKIGKIMDVPKQPSKNKSLSPIFQVAKNPKRVTKFETNLDNIKMTTESGPSVSSVSSWLQNNDFSIHDGKDMFLVNDKLKSVLEKLDTSLVESNRKTSKKFVELFVEVKNHLDDQQEQLNTVKSAIKRYEEDTKIFTEQLKKDISSIIRQDRTQKDLLTTILKEDIEAALNHMEHMKSNNS